MPGPLIEGHAKYEDDCGKCHKSFSKESQSSLCLDCHEKVAADIRTESGFHGRSKAAGTQCSVCHDDHKGRDEDVVQLSRETFDHGLTDYPLRGAHVTTPCKSCHTGDSKFREAPSACIQCHREDDVHDGELGEKCADCHGERTWARQEFDHDLSDFPLRGGHRETDCNSCHAGRQHKDTPKECYACHRFNDVHGGKYGKACNDCHGESKWKKITFDHDAKTDYPLTGGHRKVMCNACHGGGDFGRQIDTRCITCHRGDDDHDGRFGEDCGACHSTHEWKKPKFDHDKKTEFPLKGGHSDLRCNACHRGAADSKEADRTCADCHRTDDIHAGEAGSQCGSCHNETGWGESVRFEHDMTRFPLIGLHTVTPCEECHLTPVYSDTESGCNDCHRQDDIHEQRLGTSCGMCHNPNAWTLWEFDHNTQTRFELEGGHEGIDCHACHRRPVLKKPDLSSACGGCHREDDVHDGRFGRYCDRCHTTSDFAGALAR
jgi:hypothetical protein